MEREVLEFDVQFVGAGPAGLAGAIHLADLIAAHNAKCAASGAAPLPEMNIAVLEKSAEVGQHGISGAVMDPRAIAELIPDYRAKGCPLESEVTGDDVYILTEGGQFRLPLLPPALHNEGNFIVSLGELTKWLAAQAEERGVLIATETPAQAPLLEGQRVLGVRTGDKGVNRSGEHKPTYQPGADCTAKVTVLCEGPRGTIGKQLEKQLGLTQGKDPQVYATGVKELWEVPAGQAQKGRVIHTMNWPLPASTFGGGFIYGLSDSLWYVGCVTGLDAKDPTSDPHANLQRLKTHPLVRRLIEGGKPISYGAKAIPEGGWYAMPRLYADGLLLAGDTGGFLNGGRLKGVHLAIKSGMLAAEQIMECLLADDFSAAKLAGYESKVAGSWAGEELKSMRNFHQAFDGGLWQALPRTGLQMFMGGLDVFGDHLPGHAGHERMQKLSAVHPSGKPVPPKYDGKLTFDKLADVYLSGTMHDEDQPVHLVVADTSVCATQCRNEFGNPCQHFCPAAVYEMVPDEARGAGEIKLQINASNCVHCKTCDIADPYQIITWTTPEGGGGPNYKRL